MKLRIIIFLTAVGCAFGQSQESTKTAKINEIFRLTKVDEMQKQMMSQIKAMTFAQMAQMGAPPEVQAQASAASDKMLTMIMKQMNWDTMRPVFVKMYDETFTENEISGLLMFYQSDAGAAMLNKMPALQMKMMAMVQEKMKTLMPEIQKMVKEAAEGKAAN